MQSVSSASRNVEVIGNTMISQDQSVDRRENLVSGMRKHNIREG